MSNLLAVFIFSSRLAGMLYSSIFSKLLSRCLRHFPTFLFKNVYPHCKIYLRKNILFRFFMSRLYQTCPNWLKHVQTCSKWIWPVKIWTRYKLIKHVQNWSNMSEIDQTCPKLIKLVPTGQNSVQHATLSRPVQSCKTFASIYRQH